MLDADLAEIYRVPTKSLNLAVKRNADRFPEDFMFQLTYDEVAGLRFHSETSKRGRGGRRYRASRCSQASCGVRVRLFQNRFIRVTCRAVASRARGSAVAPL